MKRLLGGLAVAVLFASVALAGNRPFAGSDSYSQIYTNDSEVMTFVDSSTGPITLSSLANPTQGGSLTNIPASSINAGKLGSNVLASSITLSAMYGQPTLDGINFTDIPASSINAGSLGSNVIASSVAVNAVYPASVASGSYTNITGVGTLPNLSVTYGVSASTVTVSSWLQLVSQSSTTINGYTPSAVGQLYFCNNCKSTAVCVSTGTTAGSFTVINSTAVGSVPIHCS